MKSLKVKSFIKKAGSLLMGVSLLGASFLGAFATADNPNLGDYKNVFSEDFSVVVGDNANASDVLGALDIGLALQAHSFQKESELKSTKSKAYFSESGDLLEINEKLGDAREVFTGKDLAVLQSTLIRTDEGTTNVNHYLDFENSECKVVFEEDEYDKVQDAIRCPDGEEAFTYKIEFTEGLQSEVDNDDTLKDIEDEELMLLGKTYSFAEVKENGNELTFRLFAGKVLDSLEEGQERTYSVNGKDVTVKAVIISDTEKVVKLEVNGEMSDKLEEGETDFVGDYLIGVRDILPNEAEESTGGDIVEFWIGVDELEFTDDATDDEFSSDIEINDENIEDAEVKVIGTKVGDEWRISSIHYKLEVDGKKGDVYIAPGHGLREYLTESEGTIHPDWDIIYEGVDNVTTSIVRFDSSGDDAYDLEFTNARGTQYNVELLDNSGDFKYGSDDEGFHFVEADYDGSNEYNVNRDDSFVLTDKNNEKGVTTILTYENIDESEKRVTFRDEGNGESYEFNYQGTEGDDAKGTITVGGNSYTFYVGDEADEFPLAVDFNHDSAVDGTQANIVVLGGGILELDSDLSDNEANFVLRTLNKQFDEADTDEEIAISIASANNELDVDVDSGIELEELDDNDDVEVGMSNYGVKAKLRDEENDPNTLELEYPSSERGVNAAVVIGEKKPLVEKKAFNLKPLVASKAGNEAMILVGGPCANEMTARVLGVSSKPGVCAEGYEPGKALVKYMTYNEKAVIIVSGYEARDTRLAAQALATGLLDNVKDDDVILDTRGDLAIVLPQP